MVFNATFEVTSVVECCRPQNHCAHLLLALDLCEEGHSGGGCPVRGLQKQYDRHSGGCFSGDFLFGALLRYLLGLFPRVLKQIQVILVIICNHRKRYSISLLVAPCPHCNLWHFVGDSVMLEMSPTPLTLSQKDHKEELQVKPPSLQTQETPHNTIEQPPKSDFFSFQNQKTEITNQIITNQT